MVFQGQQVIQPEQLHERDIVEEVLLEGRDVQDIISVQRYRDLIKQWIVMEAEPITVALIGIENQTDIHYAMIVRNMLYDALNYTKQVTDISSKNVELGKSSANEPSYKRFLKEDKIKPVITIVVYWGADEWDGARCLHDLLDFSVYPQLKEVVSDYQMRLLVPAEIDDFTRFHTELKYVLEFIKNSKNRESIHEILQKRQQEFLNMNYETAQLINIVTNLNLFVRKGSKTDMCKAWEDQFKAGVKCGRREERLVMAERLIKMQKTIEEIMLITELSEEEIATIESSIMANV